MSGRRRGATWWGYNWSEGGPILTREINRGTPIDRYYIDQFLSRHAHHIRGTVAEIRDPRYTNQFGADQVTESVVIDIDPTNPQVTLVVDLAQPGSLPTARFTCIILTQTIQFLHSPKIALANCHQALVPGGVLLLTAPTVGRISYGDPEHDYWRLTPLGLQELLHRAWPGEVTVSRYGNLTACLAMLTGYAAEELPRDALEHHDPGYPLVTCAVAHRLEEIA